MSQTQMAVAELAENAALLEQQRTLGEMLARSANDREFRALMLSDARSAFAQHGIQLPEGLDVRFIENQYDVTIVLPDPLDDMIELSESELAQLNGGSDGGAVEVAVTVLSSLECFVISASISIAATIIGYTLAKS